MSLYVVANLHGEKYKSTNYPTREVSLFAGGGIRLYPLSIYTMSDMETRSQGRITRAQLQAPISTDSWLIVPTIGYTYYDQKYANYYYGVESNEVLLDRTEYHPPKGSDTFYNLRVFYKLSSNLEIYTMAEYKVFSDEVTLSPTVKLTPKNKFILGLTYKLF